MRKSNIKNKNFSYLQSLSDKELDDLLDDATYDQTNEFESLQIIMAIMDEFERRNPAEFEIGETELKEYFIRFCERVKVEDLNDQIYG